LLVRKKKIKLMRKHILNVSMALTVVALLTQTASALPVDAPEVASTSILLGLALGGMAAVRRFLSR
jgi:hypothetical protein